MIDGDGFLSPFVVAARERVSTRPYQIDSYVSAIFFIVCTVFLLVRAPFFCVCVRFFVCRRVRMCVFVAVSRGRFAASTLASRTHRRKKTCRVSLVQRMEVCK